MEKEKTAPQFKACTNYSTYWWTMHLNLDHPDNYSNTVDRLQGYSKREGHDEMKDKKQLLLTKVKFFYEWTKQFDKIRAIEMYWNPYEILDKKKSILLFTLFPKEYLISDQVQRNQKIYQIFSEAGTWEFMNKFYSRINKGQPVIDLFPEVKKPNFSKDDYFDINKQHFRTKLHLYNYCEKMIRNGHPFDQVMTFCKKYEEQKKFSS